MEIFVSELPKSCKVCPCLHDEEMCIYCNLDAFDGNNCPYKMLNKERHKDCPLKLLSERLAEERKKVMQEIREWCKESFDYTKLPNELGCLVAINREEFFNILDQIERGESNVKD